MTDKEVLLEWAKTYGEDESDIKASMYGQELMIEFARYYNTKQLKLSVVSQQRELLAKYTKWQGEYYKRESDMYRDIDKFLNG